MIDLETLLYGQPTWPEVAEYFKNGEFFEEHYLVDAIKKHLLTDDQRYYLDSANLSIEDCLNGRYDAPREMLVSMIFKDWNTKLGHKQFGF